MTLMVTSIAGSLALLIVAFVIFAFRRESKWSAPVTMFVIGIVFSVVIPSLAILLQSLVFTSLLCFPKFRSKFGFVVLSTAFTVAVYLSLFGLISLHIRQYEKWRHEYAFQSLEDRLPVLKSNNEKVALSKIAEQDLDWFSIEMTKVDALRTREMTLANLHQRTMETFVSAPEFGVRRILFPPTRERLALGEEVVIPQPGSLGDILGAEGDSAITPDDLELRTFHRESLVDFVNPRGFGLVKSRAKVAGFQSHFFRAIPRSNSFQVCTIDLMGLLTHKEPVVYVTSNLPRMAELRKSPTRPLDDFEKAGLDDLKKGGNLHIQQSKAGLRVLGAIRSADRCRACHGGDGGELLGAFSYGLIVLNR